MKYGKSRNPFGRKPSLQGEQLEWLRANWSRPITYLTTHLHRSPATIWATAKRLGLPSRPKTGRPPGRSTPAMREAARLRWERAQPIVDLDAFKEAAGNGASYRALMLMFGLRSTESVNNYKRRVGLLAPKSPTGEPIPERFRCSCGGMSIGSPQHPGCIA